MGLFHFGFEDIAIYHVISCCNIRRNIPERGQEKVVVQLTRCNVQDSHSVSLTLMSGSLFEEFVC